MLIKNLSIKNLLYLLEKYHFLFFLFLYLPEEKFSYLVIIRYILRTLLLFFPYLEYEKRQTKV